VLEVAYKSPIVVYKEIIGQKNDCSNSNSSKSINSGGDNNGVIIIRTIILVVIHF
jgi:hypothetical protein